jgi:hypothetical protein
LQQNQKRNCICFFHDFCQVIELGISKFAVHFLILFYQ